MVSGNGPVRSGPLDAASPHLARADAFQKRRNMRSLALHEAAADALEADPTLIERVVKPTIVRFLQIHQGTGTVRLLQEWESAANAGVRALTNLCRDPSERGCQLRSASCMTGIITQEQRRSIYDSFLVFARDIES